MRTVSYFVSNVGGQMFCNAIFFYNKPINVWEYVVERPPLLGIICSASSFLLVESANPKQSTYLLTEYLLRARAWSSNLIGDSVSLIGGAKRLALLLLIRFCDVVTYITEIGLTHHRSAWKLWCTGWAGRCFAAIRQLVLLYRLYFIH